MESWETADYLVKGRRNVEALFMYCLGIEKLLKANWVLDNQNNFPPRIHDLQGLRSQTNVELPSELIDFLDTVNRWNIEGRYPDYRFTIYQQATDTYLQEKIPMLNEIKECLLQRI